MNSPNAKPLADLIASLYGRINYERQLKVTPRHFKLKTMREFLRRLGDPHLQYPVIHVAGTKGKGSVSTMIGQILNESGRRTGVYLSPHLEVINQRMMLGGQLITDEQLLETLRFIEPIADQLDEESDAADRRKLTFFEVITAAAFCFFAKQSAEAVVLEVGLGGRMDSTNVCQPMVSVITNISFDHTKQLGDTLGEIAFEKAGIIKPGVPVISGVRIPEPATAIAKVAAENEAALFTIDRDFKISSAPSDLSTENSNSSARQTFSVSGSVFKRDFNHHHLSLNLVGPHQRTNAALAVATIEVFNQQLESLSLKGSDPLRRVNITRQIRSPSKGQTPLGIGSQLAQPVAAENDLTTENTFRVISGDSIRRGLAEAHLPGRTEIVRQQPTVLLDIAHNVASVAALIETLGQLAAWQESAAKTLIVSISNEKDVAGMLKVLLPCFNRVICTKYQNNPRAQSAEALLELAREIVTGFDQSPALLLAPDPTTAWQTVINEAKENEFICIAGSAFLVAEMRPLAIL